MDRLCHGVAVLLRNCVTGSLCYYADLVTSQPRIKMRGGLLYVVGVPCRRYVGGRSTSSRLYLFAPL